MRWWDGADVGVANQSAYDLYTRHILTRPYLAAYQVHGQADPGDALLLDRLERTLSVGPFSKASHFVAMHRYEVDAEAYARQQGEQALRELRLSEWLSQQYAQAGRQWPWYDQAEEAEEAEKVA